MNKFIEDKNDSLCSHNEELKKILRFLKTDYMRTNSRPEGEIIQIKEIAVTLTYWISPIEKALVEKFSGLVNRYLLLQEKVGHEQ